METQTLQAEVRDSRGKGPARRLRAQGKVPGVFYGPGLEPTPLTLSPKELEKALRGERGRNVVFALSVGGKEELAMVKDVTVVLQLVPAIRPLCLSSRSHSFGCPFVQLP